MDNIIIVKLDSTYAAVYSGIWQWNYGQILRIQGGNLPKVVEVHFSLQDKGGDSITRIGTTIDGATDVPIPDSFLENGGRAQDYKIYAFIYLEDGSAGNTAHKIEMSVKSRPKPEVPGTPEEPELFGETVKAVNAAAGRAETAEKNAKQYAADAEKTSSEASESAENAKNDREAVEKLKSEFGMTTESVLRTATDARNEAESWAHGHVGYPDRDKDNAMYYSEAAKQVATKNGYCRMEINENGHLILERTENIKDSLDFRLNEKGHLEVMME